MDIHSIILQPLMTEKSTLLNQARKYTVIVHDDATKIDIKRAIETIYQSKVLTIRIVKMPKKTRALGRGKMLTKRPAVKKAVITLKKGEKAIDFIKTKKSK